MFTNYSYCNIYSLTDSFLLSIYSRIDDSNLQSPTFLAGILNLTATHKSYMDFPKSTTTL